MEDSILYDLIEAWYLGKYREMLNKENDDYFSQSVIKSRQLIEKTFNEEQLKLIDRYRHEITLREENIEIQTSIKLLNYGVKIGMQLQKAFDELK